eukprot:14821032-Alexandrium_andersonii.AAC.1
MHQHDAQVLAIQETRLFAIQTPSVLGFCRSRGVEVFPSLPEENAAGQCARGCAIFSRLPASRL